MNAGQQIRGAAGYASNTVGDTAKYADPISPIPAAIDRLQGAVSGLDSDLSTLHDRLHRVLRDAPPATATGIGGAVPQSPTSQTFQQLATLTERVERLNAFVRDIMDRLEA